MALNDAFMQQMQKQIDDAKNRSNIVAPTEQETTLEIGNGDSVDAPDGAETTKVQETLPVAQEQQNKQPDTAAELEALRQEIAALKAAKVEPASSEPKKQADDDAIEFYESPEQRQSLVDQLGEEVVKAHELMFARALTAKDKVTQKKLSALEERNQSLEKTHQSAEFTRAVGADVLNVFNDPTFQAVAKGIETGYRRTLLDELNTIVKSSDIEGAEYLRSQIEKYNTGKGALRKAQVAPGKAPGASSRAPQVFDKKHADTLVAKVMKHKPGTAEFNKAKAEADKYLALAVTKQE